MCCVRKISRVHKCHFIGSKLTIPLFLASALISLQGSKVDGVPVIRPLKLDDFIQSKAKVKSSAKALNVLVVLFGRT